MMYSCKQLFDFVNGQQFVNPQYDFLFNTQTTF